MKSANQSLVDPFGVQPTGCKAIDLIRFPNEVGFPRGHVHRQPHVVSLKHCGQHGAFVFKGADCGGVLVLKITIWYSPHKYNVSENEWLEGEISFSKMVPFLGGHVIFRRGSKKRRPGTFRDTARNVPSCFV